MITHLRGQLISKNPGRVVVEAAGLGYELAVPLSTFLTLPEPPVEIFLHTRLFIREDSWDLYGFGSLVERETFLALTGVNRIGPKLALTIISALEPAELARALMTSDLSTLSAIKGIGGKTAERLLVELKDKAPKLAALAGLSAEEVKKSQSSTGATNTPQEDEAISALVNLGYTPAEARKTIAKVLPEVTDPKDLGTILRLALKNLTKPLT